MMEEDLKNLPDGWFCIWCPACLASITWTQKVLVEFDFDDWFEELSWIVNEEIEHNLEKHEEFKKRRSGSPDPR